MNTMQINYLFKNDFNYLSFSCSFQTDTKLLFFGIAYSGEFLRLNSRSFMIMTDLYIDIQLKPLGYMVFFEKNFLKRRETLQNNVINKL